ncbi:MAG: MerR family transcriptional regulator [Treponema sp.]|jgi:DNA-binding transcriptional MerR regulator|nr:MerR family transcriptional regulator [Treponema sp.]
MNDLIKIKDVSDRYDISARTLRYYEDMGLITSTRNYDYAYRLYDETAIKKLEQILILRKLNISIRDIKRIFDTSGSQVVLEVLGKKVDDIDGEISLLQELREIVLEFIRQIEKADFTKDSDVKMLYDKAKEIEGLVHIGYEGNPSGVNRLLDVTERLRKTPEVRIVNIKPFRAVTSGLLDFGVLFGEFHPWMVSHNHLFKKSVFGGEPEFFLVDCPYHLKNCPCEVCQMKGQFIYAAEDTVNETDTAPYNIINFEGGLYAAVMAVDEDENMITQIEKGVYKWLETSGFELDEDSGRRRISQMVNATNEIKTALGYNQLDIFVPVKIRHDAASLGINPYPRLNLSSPSGYQIVDLPDEDRSNVMKVIQPKSWAVAIHNLDNYKGKKVTLTFSVDVKRVGAAGTLNWQINNSDYPSVGTPVTNAAAKGWHSMSGTWTGILSADNPAIFLGTYNSNSESTTYYIDKFNIDVKQN